MKICIKLWMKTFFHTYFYVNFHASVTLLILFGFSRNINLNVELRNWVWYTPFWEVFTPKSSVGKSLRLDVLFKHDTQLSSGSRGRTLVRVRTKKLIFLFLNQNICCEYSKDPSQWDGSFEHPKHMLKLMGKKMFTISHSKTLFI